MSLKTPLYDCHVRANAMMVDFSGWQMPLHYGSQLQEHRAVREKAGMFDVSHMGVIEITGADTVPFLRYVLANDVVKLKNLGDALYSCMLNEAGGIIDDLIAYRFTDTLFRLIVNAGCRNKDFAWLAKQATAFDAQLRWRNDVCLIALQGPEAIDYLHYAFDAEIAAKAHALKPFKSLVLDAYTVIACTGYTGEAGVEMMLPVDRAIQVWQTLIDKGVQPCGLGARDTLRLEAGLNLYGVDMTENTSPLISNLSWTIAWKDAARDFIGRDALLAEKARGVSQQLIGLVLETKGVLRNHQKVKLDDSGEGEITSGSFSPSLNHAIALARIPMCNTTSAMIERRGEWLPVRIMKPPFLKDQ